MINDALQRLTEYPFPRLAGLLDGIAPPPGTRPVILSIGDPQHPAPDVIGAVLHANAHLWNRYPPLDGTPEFREAACGWLRRRFAVADGLIDPDRAILPLSGTREGLFLSALLTVPARKGGATPAVCMPNPFYAPYEGAARMAGAEPVFLHTDAGTGFLPDLDALTPSLLDRTALFYLCSPGNPQGAAAPRAYLERLIGLARRHGFVLALDECYTEIYGGEPPAGGLEAAGGALDNLLLFQSLSKRSNAAGLRAGFTVGDPRLIASFRRLRGYAAAGMPLPIQAAAAALWRDDAHVETNRALYRAKFDAAERALAGRLPFRRPDGGFFLWLEVGDGEAAARRLWGEAGIKVLPGAYLAQPDADGINRADSYIRVALVHDEPVVRDALERLADILSPARPRAVGAA
ncbi:MAG: aminotransferase class I/II-fold pyridoxal phosphate-dependent enzyme [Inquilinaceae bacterium]